MDEEYFEFNIYSEIRQFLDSIPDEDITYCKTCYTDFLKYKIYQCDKKDCPYSASSFEPESY